MNILSINNLAQPKVLNQQQAERNRFSHFLPKFGLKIAQPLKQDTVSFSGFVPTKKTCGDLKGACSAKAAKIIRNKHIDAHLANLKTFKTKFSSLLSTEESRGSITLLNRLKSIFSIQLKTASLGIGELPNSEIQKKINDVSGFCFILENNEAYNNFVKIFNSMIKHGEINPTEAEYHRLAPTYKKGKLERSYDSLNPALSQKLKNTIYDVKNPTTQIWKEIDSRSGYSGLHITIKNTDGTKSEIQVMTRAEADLKHYENLYYKFRNGKPLDPKYKMLEPILKPLKPIDPESLTDEERFLQKALTKYTQEAYNLTLENPYEANLPFLKVSEAKTLTLKEKELIEPFDFNKIKLLVDACDKYDSL